MSSTFHFFALLGSIAGMLFCFNENNFVGLLGWFVASISQLQLLMAATK